MSLLLPFVMAVTFALRVIVTPVLRAERGAMDLFYTAHRVSLASSA